MMSKCSAGPCTWYTLSKLQLLMVNSYRLSVVVIMHRVIVLCQAMFSVFYRQVEFSSSNPRNWCIL